jgi:hypothetical protein
MSSQALVEVLCIPAARALLTELHEVYEYQRWGTIVKWGSTPYPGHFLKTDPGK